MTTEKLLAECEEYLSSNTVTIDPNYRSSIRLVQSLAGHVRTLNTVLHAVEKTPHPDTARADAAERMLGHILEVVTCESRDAAFVDVPGVREWWESYCKDIKRRILANNLADAESTAARLRAELAALDGGGTP